MWVSMEGPGRVGRFSAQRPRSVPGPVASSSVPAATATPARRRNSRRLVVNGKERTPWRSDALCAPEPDGRSSGAGGAAPPPGGRARAGGGAGSPPAPRGAPAGGGGRGGGPPWGGASRPSHYLAVHEQVFGIGHIHVYS